MVVMADATEHIDLERLEAAIAAVEPEPPMRRSFSRLRTEDPVPAPPADDLEAPTRRWPRARTHDK